MKWEILKGSERDFEGGEEALREMIPKFLDYNKDTGVFTWKAKSSPKANRAVIGSVAGAKDSKGYLNIKLFGWRFKAHRLAYLLEHGSIAGKLVDHVNGIKDDNRIENLRLATDSQNQWNTKVRVSNQACVKGVSFKKDIGKWRARISAHGEKYDLGYFETKESAADALALFRAKIHGEYANHG
jgi:hypothetical protein